MKVVVAGANGFIGRRAVAALEAAGHQVFPLLRGDIAKIAAPAPFVLQAKRSDPLPRHVGDDHREADVLVWAAGKREATARENTKAHVKEPEAALDILRTPRVVYLSTGEVYGDAPLPYREDGPLASTSDYASAKRLGELAVRGRCEDGARIRIHADQTARVNAGTRHGKGAIVLRVGLVYGPDQSPRMLIPRLVAALRAGEHFGLTHGEQTRDLVFVDDVAQAIVRAVESPASGTFNVASGTEVRIREVCEGIARAIARRSGRPPEELLALLGFGEVALRPDEATRYVMDVSKAAEVLGWRATTTLADGFATL